MVQIVSVNLDMIGEENVSLARTMHKPSQRGVPRKQGIARFRGWPQKGTEVTRWVVNQFSVFTLSSFVHLVAILMAPMEPSSGSGFPLPTPRGSCRAGGKPKWRERMPASSEQRRF